MKLLKKALFLSVFIITAAAANTVTQTISMTNTGYFALKSQMNMTFQAADFAQTLHANVTVSCYPVACSKVYSSLGVYYQTIFAIQRGQTEVFKKTVSVPARESTWNYFNAAYVSFGLYTVRTQSYNLLSGNSPLPSTLSISTGILPSNQWSSAGCISEGSVCSLNPYQKLPPPAKA